MPQPSTILVVDDTANTLELIATILGTEHKVLTAGDGETATKIALQEEPDLILLDIRMPGMDGYQLCKLLKADPVTREIPVIFVTAMDEEREEAKGLELGAIDYITKPLSPPILRARVRNHIDLKRQRDQLRRLSAVDGLTGLANRRAFAEALEKEWRGAIRRNTSISLLMTDIDDFKQFNDAYGHLAGDEALRRVAKALESAALRPADMVARYGGEEFVILLPDTGANEAALVADRLLLAVRRLAIPHEHSRGWQYVSLSVGLASARPSREMNANELLDLADRMLYQAKSGGRNRVVTANLDTPEEPAA
ncbi:MAG TPA: diguanylate cyclase [Dongiaceae bacterium]|nr:diguanylate cyclase [Dongiaceae bacterium]